MRNLYKNLILYQLKNLTSKPLKFPKKPFISYQFNPYTTQTTQKKLTIWRCLPRNVHRQLVGLGLSAGNRFCNRFNSNVMSGIRHAFNGFVSRLIQECVIVAVNQLDKAFYFLEWEKWLLQGVKLVQIFKMWLLSYVKNGTLI